MARSYKFETERMIVNKLRSVSIFDNEMANAVKAILTPRVTQYLPEGWQGEYSIDRAIQWIEERERESVLLLALERLSKSPIGLMILFESVDDQAQSSVRLGFMLAEETWGRGFASELVKGLVQWSGSVGISSLIGGVERENIASQRVMEKSGFVAVQGSRDHGELLYKLVLK